MTSTDATDAERRRVACILGRSQLRLWGLTGSERLERQLRTHGVTEIVHGSAAASGRGPVVIVSSDWLFDDRMLQGMLKSPATILQVSAHGGPPRAVAANVDAAEADAACAAIEGTLDASTIPGVTVRDAATFGASYVRKVLKANRPRVLHVREDNREVLERYLFDESYKGVTDLVTKFVWPAPARRAVGICTKLGIRPNAVTAASLMLVILAGWLFTQGRFLEGLAAGWVMTFLDTVDGKLARVTITSTPAGHIFDHGIDLVHPPLWYVAWAWGLSGGHLSQYSGTLIAIFAGYIGGRMAERFFSHRVASFSMFAWQPFDSFFRLITGRRNPNMLLLSLLTLCGRPDWGLEMVAAWTVVSSGVLLTRLAQGFAAKGRGETMRPWLEKVEPDAISSVPRYARAFLADPAARLAAQES